jgi:redox-sensitive bicupin YhaK (pirin superfamily)
MDTVFHKADTRGFMDNGWLKSYQTFSFSGYYHPERIQFGALRVLNDDKVKGGGGFGDHPHDNMEIISIPLKGGLVHMDSLGNSSVIRPGEIQVMSAGTGIYHTEYNQDENLDAEFLQIWLYPNKRNVIPRYDQTSIKYNQPNYLTQILSPDPDDAGVWIHQNAWFHIGEFKDDTELEYELKDTQNGVYAFMINGSAMINEQLLDSRDGLGVWNTERISIKALKGAKVLLIEVPMTV